MKNYVVDSEAFETVDPSDSSNQKLLLQELIAREVATCIELERIAEQITFYGSALIHEQVAERRTYLQELVCIEQRLLPD